MQSSLSRQIVADGTELGVVPAGPRGSNLSAIQPPGVNRHHRPETAALDSPLMPWIFAAKTTASALLALLIAFTFNLDQPKWCALTVFIVAQPQSGLVLAKSFYRIIGNVIGAAIALLLVALFAQERVLFLGTLGIWIGICTFVSKYARNFASYGAVISGYTVAIVGVSGALAPSHAFYIATARVTEISLGIICTALINHLVLPVSLANALSRAIAGAQAALTEYASTLLSGGDHQLQRATLIGQVVAIENLRASAIFEDRDIRARSKAVQNLESAALSFVSIGYLLGRSLDLYQDYAARIDARLQEVLSRLDTEIELWGRGAVSADGLRQRFATAVAELPAASEVGREAPPPDAQWRGRATLLGRLPRFCAAFVGFADAEEAFRAPPSHLGRRPRFALANDPAGAVWAGVRAGLALLLVGTFWILTNWPAGMTATILTPLAAARVATMDNPVKTALGGTIIIALAVFPSFILIEVLLPLASGFPTFALVAGPVFFLCALLLASPSTAGIGFLASLYFAYAGTFLDRMAYDPVGFLNTSFAIVLAAAITWLLYAIVVPDTPAAVYRRFLRIVRKTFGRIAGGRASLTRSEFESIIAEALVQTQRDLPSGASEGPAAVEIATSLMGLGCALIELREVDGHNDCVRKIAERVTGFLAHREPRRLDDTIAAASTAGMTSISEPRAGVADKEAAERTLVVSAAIGEELERLAELMRNQP